jgi:peptide/nickel transport system permease protein
VAVLGLLAYVSATGWFLRPALGPAVIALASLGVALGMGALVAGLGHRGVRRSCLATAAVGSAVQFAVTPWLQDPRWASWTNVMLLLAIALGIAAAVGLALGGLDRAQAVRASTATASIIGAIIILDIMLRSVPGYAERVGGRVFATIGARTPNLEGTFWEQQIDIFTHLLLPTLSILLISFATYSRYARATMLDVMKQDYVRTARAKGLSERAVVVRHAFRNALIPITTLAALDFGALIAGALITEYVFGWQGMGTLFFTGLVQVDPNPVMAFYIVTALSVALFNLLADIAYAYLDPRIRLS